MINKKKISILSLLSIIICTISLLLILKPIRTVTQIHGETVIDETITDETNNSTTVNLADNEEEPVIDSELSYQMSSVERVDDVSAEALQADLEARGLRTVVTPTANIVKTGLIPSGFPFVMMFKSGKTSVQSFGVTPKNGHTTDRKGMLLGRGASGGTRGKVGLIFRNAGIYNGEWVDVKVTYLNWEDKTHKTNGVGPWVQYYTNSFRTDFSGLTSVHVKYDMFKAGTTTAAAGTGTPINVKGYFTFADIDYTEGLWVPNFVASSWQKFYLHDKTFLNGGMSGNNLVTEATGKDAQFEATPEAFSTGTFNGNTISVLYKNNIANDRVTMYPNPGAGTQWTYLLTTQKSRPTDLSAVSKSITSGSSVNVLNNKLAKYTDKMTYNISLNVPIERSEWQYKSFVLSDALPKDFRVSKVTITDTDNAKDVTANFTIVTKNGTATAAGSVSASAKAANLATNNFYGVNYQMKIEGAFASIQNDYWKTTKYVIPNTASAVAVNKVNNTLQKNSNTVNTDVAIAPKIVKTVKNITENSPATHGASADVKFGDVVEFKLLVTSPDGTIANATVNDQMPTGLTLTSWSLNGVNKNMTDVVNNKLTTIYSPAHVKGTTHTLLIRAKVATSGLANGLKITNTATLSSTGNAAVSASAFVTHYLPTHTITKAATNVSGAAVGTTTNQLDWPTAFFYDITYKNTSTKGVTNPTIVDTLPAGIKATGRNVQYKLNGATVWANHTGNLVNQELTKLDTAAAFSGVNPGQTLIIRIPVKATGATVQGKTLANTANSTAKYSLLAATTTKTNVANVSGANNVVFKVPNMTITKQVKNVTEKLPATGYAANADIKYGDDVEFEIKITNANGAGTATAPVFKDVLPAGLTFTKWFYNGADKGTTGWNATTKTLTSNYATNHNPNVTVTIRVLAKVATSGLTNTQKLTNTASVSATGVAAKSATAFVTHYLPTHTLAKSANNAGGTAVGTATNKLNWPTAFFYDITYTNTATKGVMNPTIVDTLPTGIKATSQNVQFKLSGATSWTNDTNQLISEDLTKLNTGTRFTGINPKQSLTVRIPVKAVDGASVQGKTLTNTASATAKYSLLFATTAKNNVANINGATPVQFLLPNITITKQVKNVTEKIPTTGYAADTDAKYGDDVEFEIKIANANGVGTAPAPEFKDVLPAGLTFTKWFYNGADKGTTGWNAATRTLTSKYATNHNPNTTVTIRVLAKVATSGLTNTQKLTNTASVSATGVGAKSATAFVTHYLPTHTITKAATNVSGAAVGTTTNQLDWPTAFFYDITYKNTSTKGVTNPTIVDTLPAGIKATGRNVQYKLNGATAWANHTGNLVNQELTKLDTAAAFSGVNPGQTLIIRIPVKATGATVQGKTLANTANSTAKYSLLAATTTKTNVANVSGANNVVFKVPNMTITKQVKNVTEKLPATGYAANADIKYGDDVEFEIKITNANGAGTAAVPEFKDVLPAGLTFTKWFYNGADKGTTGWNATTKTLTSNYATNHNPNATVTIRVLAKVATSGLTNTQKLTNTASVSATGVAAKSATAFVTNYLPAHTITKAAHDESGKIVGQTNNLLDWPTTFYYDIVYQNTSTKGVSNPQLIDTLPQGVKATGRNVQFKVDNAATWTTDTNNLISEDLLKLDTGTRFTGFNPSQKLTVRIPVKAISGNSVQGKKISNTVSATGQYSLLNATTQKNTIAVVTNKAEVTFKVPDLKITKLVRNGTENPTAPYEASAPIKEGDVVDFEIKLSNAAGAGTAATPELKELLPKGLRLKEWFYQGSSKGVTGWNATTNTLTTKYATNHNPGATVTIRVLAEIDKTVADQQVLSNKATLSASGVVEKTAAATVDYHVPKNSLQKTASKAMVSLGEEFIYTLTYTNESVQPSTKLKSAILPIITDELVTGLTAKANTTEYSQDGGKTYTALSDEAVWTNLSKLNTKTTLPAVVAGANLSIRFTAIATKNIVGKTINNQGLLTGKYYLSNPKTTIPAPKKEGDVSVKVLDPAITLTKKVKNLTETPTGSYGNQAAAKPGDKADFEIKISNLTTAGSVSEPVLKELLPEGLSLDEWFYNGVSKGKTGWNESTRTLTTQYAPYHLSGETVTIRVLATVGKDVADEKQLTNTATISGANIGAKSAQAIVINHLPKYEIKKIVSQKEVLNQETFDYTLIVRNTSKLASSYITPVLTDKLPDSVKAIANTTKVSSDGGVTYTNISDKVWSEGFTQLKTATELTKALKSGAELRVKFTVKSSARTSRELTNTGILTGKFGLSETTTTLPVLEQQDSVSVQLKVDARYLNIRQVVINAHQDLVLPKLGYSQLDLKKDLTQVPVTEGLMLTIPSTIKDSDVKLADFRQSQLILMKEARWAELAMIMPEYYEYQGHVASVNPDLIALEHQSSQLIKEQPKLDYQDETEYWVTVYLSPKYGAKETEPRPYSWSSIINKLGGLKEP